MGQAVGVLSVVGSATALVLDNASAKKLYVTGTIAQTIRLPAIAQLEVGVEYIIFNRSSASVTVTDSASANPMTIATNTTGRITLINKTDTGLWLLA